MKPSIRFWLVAFCLNAFSLLALWNCNLSTPEEIFFLKVSVHDSLTVESGKYDTIEVDLLDTNGAMVQKHLFYGPYFRSDSSKLAKLPLLASPPANFTVRITAHSKTSNDTWVLVSKVVNGAPQPLVVSYVAGTDSLSGTPTRITITSPKNAPLYVGDTVLVSAVLDKAGSTPELIWSSSNPSVAALAPGGKLVGLTPGPFTLKVATLSGIALSDSVYLSVQPIPTILPESVLISNSNPLLLTAGSAPVTLNAVVRPAEARQSVVWTLPASDLAVLEQGNQIRPLKAGTLKITASSSIAPTIFTVLDITISDSARTLDPDTIVLRMPVPMALAPNGAESPILWSVLPSTASQEVLWSSSDTSIAKVTSGDKVKPVKLGKATITGTSKAKAAIQIQFEVNVVRAVQVDSITLNPKSLKLYTGGTDGQVNVTLVGSDTGAQYALSSSDATIASVDGTGAVKALKAGSARITASVVGYPAIASVCTVTVVTDTPQVTLTPDQTVTYGGEATFKMSITQAYGTVAEIKADMDGNGLFERTLLGVDTATFKANYTQVKIFDLAFQVKDSEGNVVTLARKVTVSPPAAPNVQITDPAAAITVNTLTYTVKFTVKDPTKSLDETKDSVVTLVEGPNTIRVSRTNVGGTGSASVVITVNRTAPGTPVFVAQPAITADNTPTWTWAAVTGATKYQVRLDDGDFTKTTGTLDVTVLTHTPTTLADGPHTLFVRSLDALGNASSPASQAVTVDTRPPAAVTFTGLDSSYTASATPTWTWAPSTTNSGTGVYVLKLDAGAEFDWTTTSFTPTTAQQDNAIHTLTVKEKDQVPGVNGTARSFSYRVKVDPPSAPTVRSAATGVVNNGLTNNPGFAWTSGGGGNGKFRVRLNSETTYRINGVAQTTWSIPTTNADGVYTVRVSEQDDMGRWGAEGTFTITLDRTAPQFANVKIQGKTYALRDGYITNASSVIIDYTSDGTARQLSCSLTDNASTACRGTAITDAAGNSATFQTTIWRRSNVIFFSPSGTGDGSSWEDAAGDIQAVVDQAGSDGKDFWLASGNYTTRNNSLTIWGKTVNMLGGFLLTNYPTNTTGRTKGASILAHISFMGSNGNFDGIQFNPSTDGLGLGLSLGTEASPATFVDCIFRGGFQMALGGSIRFTNCQMTGVSRYVPMDISAGTMVWTGGSITNNTPESGNYAIEVRSGASATFNGTTTISGNKPTFVSYQIRNEGTLVVAPTVTMPCADILWEESGTGSCGGVSH